MTRHLRLWLVMHLRWRRCACGEMRVAPGARTELAGVSHGETPCYVCKSDGTPL